MILRKGTQSNLNSTRRVALALALCLLIPASHFAQKAQRGRAAAAAVGAQRGVPRLTAAAAQGINLSALDLSLLVEELGVPPQARAELAANEGARKEFVQNLREMFAVAQAARDGGVAARPEIKLQLELSHAVVLARRYAKKRNVAVTSPEQIVSKEEIATFIKEAGQEQKFQEFLQSYLKTRPQPELTGTLTNEQRENLRQEWAKIILSARKAVAAGVDKERASEVMLAYNHASLLAGEYFRQTLDARTKATDAELEAYFTQHPELDPKQTITKAEEVLTKLRAGGDFAALAKEFSADSSKDQGGDLGWFGRGMMVKPFEDAAFALKPGELSGIVETQFGYHIIKLDERRTQNGANGQPAEEVHARHILLAPPASGGDPNGRPQAPRERARREVEKAKRDKLFGEIVSRSRVVIAGDFDANPSAATLKAASSQNPTRNSPSPTHASTPAASKEVKGTGKKRITGAGSSRRRRP